MTDSALQDRRDASPRPRARPVLAALAVACLGTIGAVGCGGDANDEEFQLVDAGDPSPDTSQPDTGLDASTDGGGDTRTDTEDPPPLENLPDCRTSSPQQVSSTSTVDAGPWLAAVQPDSAGLSNALDRGDFEMPGDGDSAYNTTWNEISIDEDGVLDVGQYPQGSVLYAAAQVTVPEDTVYVARAEGIFNVYVGDQRQPGDIYAHGDKRIPIPLEAGDNTIVLEFQPQRGHSIEILDTDDAVFFNTQDITAPSLRVGSDTTQPIGVQMVNLTEWPLRDVSATVVENEYVNETTIDYPSLGPDAVNQISWRLSPKQAWQSAGEAIPVTLRFDACALETAYEKTVELETVAPGDNFKRTFRSPIDGSTQYYSVVPPTNESSAQSYGLVLTLHGAGVEATGQANAYTRKDWAYIVAPTNRRRFGFDWEEWGHHNGMAALSHAKSQFNIDETDVHVTGHSMGGHGTWHFGVMHPGTFATVNPSAGWGSIYTYPPGRTSERPDEPIQSARAHSATREWLPNISDRAAYIVHGGADNNVPTSEGVDMRDEAEQYCDDVQWHEEEGAGHWWDRDDTPGTDCVDWPPMFQLMENRTVDPAELNFEFITPGPYYSAEHAYVTIRSRATPVERAKLVSETTSSDVVRLTTTNVRSMTIDGAALTRKGITDIEIGSNEDAGESGEIPYTTMSVEDGPMDIGPNTGKQLGRTGPLNQAFQTPFCFIYPARPTGDFRSYVSDLQSIWSVRGNGHSCALPANYIDQTVRDEYTLIYVGTSSEQLPDDATVPFDWSDGTITLNESNTYDEAAGFLTFPTPPSEGKGVAAVITAPGDKAYLLNRYQPFSSRSGLPDYLIFDETGGQALGFFGPEWKVVPGLGAGVTE